MFLLGFFLLTDLFFMIDNTIFKNGFAINFYNPVYRYYILPLDSRRLRKKQTWKYQHFEMHFKMHFNNCNHSTTFEELRCPNFSAMILIDSIHSGPIFETII